MSGFKFWLSTGACCVDALTQQCTPDLEERSLGCADSERTSHFFEALSASRGDSLDCDSDNEHAEGSYCKGLPSRNAMSRLERLMEEQDQSGENAYRSADECRNHRETCESIVYLHF
jgi:hypothetical protein